MHMSNSHFSSILNLCLAVCLAVGGAFAEPAVVDVADDALLSADSVAVGLIVSNPVIVAANNAAMSPISAAAVEV